MPRHMNLTPLQRTLVCIKVDADTHCWNYTGRKDKDGYGSVSSGMGPRHLRAHRVAYEGLVGPIPEGMMVCHTCDNRPCCNPAHLFLGDALVNNQDREAKGRGADRTGNKNPMAKLTFEQVQDIHARYAQGESMESIGARYGTGFQNVSLIVRGINRKADYEIFHGKPPEPPAPKARLTPEQAEAIRTSAKSGVDLAREYNISPAQVSRIRSGKRYKQKTP